MDFFAQACRASEPPFLVSTVGQRLPKQSVQEVETIAIETLRLWLSWGILESFERADQVEQTTTEAIHSHDCFPRSKPASRSTSSLHCRRQRRADLDCLSLTVSGFPVELHTPGTEVYHYGQSHSINPASMRAPCTNGLWSMLVCSRPFVSLTRHAELCRTIFQGLIDNTGHLESILAVACAQKTCESLEVRGFQLWS